MAASFLKKFGRLLQSRQKRKASGFTLIELLVVIIIAGGIISGLMYLVVELLGVDQRESSRTETQREMQLAMDYIASELREAVYVYDGGCFAGLNTASAANPPNNCLPLIDSLPAALRNANNIPVLAFWKQQSIPEPVKVRCSGPNVNTAISNGDPCTSASSYALIVYYISREPNPIWDGNARIKRYALTEFQADGTSNNVFATPSGQGYVRPDEVSVKFDTWPYGTNPTTNQPGNLQGGRLPTDTSAILVDFLDNRVAGGTVPDPACPTGYRISPANTTFTRLNAPQIRSFYACVDAGATSGRNREVILYIRGNAQGRPGIRGANTFVPTLETRVLVRGVLGRNP